MRTLPKVKIFLMLVMLAGAFMSPVTSFAGRVEGQQAVPGRTNPFIAQASSQPLSRLRFEMISPKGGWLAVDNALFWTTDNGESWLPITPIIPQESTLASVFFLDALQGWVASTTLSEGKLSTSLYRTKNGGESWETFGESLNPQMENVEFPLSGQLRMQWLTPDQGWLLFKGLTHANFSLGFMFATGDGGQSWSQLEAPSGEDFVFLNSQTAFMPYGSLHDGLMMTQDGAKTWQQLTLDVERQEPTNELRFGLPSILNNGAAVLPVFEMDEGVLVKASMFASSTLGSTWLRGPSQRMDLAVDGDDLPNYSVDTQGNLVLWQMTGLTSTLSGEGLGVDFYEPSVEGISTLDTNRAWGHFVSGICTDINPEQSCTQTQGLATTIDGGKTWEVLTLPAEAILSATAIQPATASGVFLDDDNLSQTTLANTQVFIGQGFDTCSTLSLTKLATWRASSPYRALGLYLGGVSAYCPNKTLLGPQLRQLYTQGWRFIPTWVGPQAPCTTFKNKFDLDPTKAYQQGVDNANQASAALSRFELANPDGTESVMYYDLEYFKATTACTQAVRAFLRGWNTRLNQLNIMPGLYATSGNMNTNQLYNLTPAISAAWIAEWYSSYYYRPNITVFDVDYLPDTYWSNHERVYQYTGGHSETWGGVTLGIDNDVIDGIVAGPFGSDFSSPISSIALSGTIMNGWYKTPVTVTLSATDSDSTIRGIYYRVNDGAWVQYSAPFVVNTSGVNRIDYSAVDAVYNWEITKSREVKIDLVAPDYPTNLNPGCRVYSGLLQGVCNDLNFSWSSPADAHSGAANVYYYWGTNPNGATGILATANGFNPAPVPDRTTYYLRFRVMDTATNLNTWKTLFVLKYDARFTRQVTIPILVR